MYCTTLAVLALCFAPSLAQDPTTDIPPWQTGIITEDGTCGKDTPGWVCTPTWGSCCGKSGTCGRSTAFCGDGCQVGYGNCIAPVTQPPAPGPGSPSTDGSCGGTNQFNCTGTAFGECCSSGGWCGQTPAHCGVGCQASFGKCVDSGDTSSDGRCGLSSGGKKCIGSGFGDCCSSGDFCGSSPDHCGLGCQAGFGNCTGGTGGGGIISTDGSCGANGKICSGSTFGECCSSSGFCGNTAAHCQVSSGCQPDFGTCEGNNGNVSTDGACGKNGKTCKGSTFGECCSGSGFCGKTDGHCTAGCQPQFGTCSTGGNVSTDGQCGPTNGKTCKGSTFGDCCSSSGFCGQSTTHCEAGCQPNFGTCGAGTNISIDGKCGSSNGKTCKGSTFGDCCSSSGFCGQSTTHCEAGCQPSFGTCGAGSNISIDGKCATNGKTCKGSTYGDCCSSAGFCGGTTTHCTAGCQPKFGTCSGGAGSISTDGKCASNGKTCAGSTFGNCCSSGNFCGSAAAHCGQGCNKSYSSGCLTTNIPSNDGSCGASKGGYTCAGGAFNNQCCSSGGFCGTTTNHCGSGCQKNYGRCT